jgi:hypothetical protein
MGLMGPIGLIFIFCFAKNVLIENWKVKKKIDVKLFSIIRVLKF